MMTTLPSFEDHANNVSTAHSAVHGFDVLSNVEQQPWTDRQSSWWDRLKHGCKRMAAGCFGLREEFEMQENEGKVRNRIRREMQVPIVHHPSHTALDVVMYDVFAATGYDLSDLRVRHQEALEEVKEELAATDEVVEAPLLEVGNDEEEEMYYADLVSNVDTQDPETEVIDRGVVAVLHPPQTLEELWAERAAKDGLAPNYLTLPAHTRACIIPKFVAAMVVTLRSHFGRLPFNEANRLLIEREYLRIARKGNVRDHDIAHHSQWVFNTYFSEDLFEETPMVRRRVPRWMRAAGRPLLVEPPTAC